MQIQTEVTKRFLDKMFQNSRKCLIERFRESLKVLIFEPKMPQLCHFEHNSNFPLQTGSVTYLLFIEPYLQTKN